MEYIIMWAVFPFAAASLAKGKNRNATLWIFLGILLGPLAILIIAFLKSAPGPDQGYH